MELAVVLALSGMMMGYMFSVVDNVDSSQKSGCAVSTRGQLNYIRAQIEAFARNNDRLPLPSRRDVALGSGYGVEDDGSHITNVAGTSWGSLPFMTLGLGASYANDCWGNKFTYAVTTALTTNASSVGYLDSTVLGNMALKSSAANTVNSEIAYAIISHGRDELGAVKVSYAVNGAQGWCTGSTDIAYTNCLADSATIMNAPFNDGKDAGANYFDDVVVASGRPVVLPTEYFAFGWGNNQYSQVGNKFDVSGLVSPTLVYGGITFSSIDTHSSYFTCGLTAAGAAYCWGYNNDYQLGDGTNASRGTPTPVLGGLTFTSISTGYTHACGLTAAGAAYCWGWNDVGQIGIGNVVTPQPTPVPVIGGHVFTSISAGGLQTCAISDDTNTYCWGQNNLGQIGVGSVVTPKSTPVAVIGGHTFTSIAAGYSFVCGLTAAGDAFCWGDNSSGQLGIGSVVTPKTSPFPVSGGHTFSKIWAGGIRVCGITTTGETYCWGGNNNFGAAGSGDTVTPKTSPSLVIGGLTFNSIAMGSYHTCGLTAAGVAYCWGYNNFGQIGTGDKVYPQLNPTPVTGGLLFNSIIAGSDHTCGLTSAGTTYCWGGGQQSTAGQGADRLLEERTATKGGLTFTTISTSKYFACGLTTDGKAYCWGQNATGRLGTGVASGATVTTPGPVTGGHTFTSLVGGVAHTCGLTAAGEAWCWGYNQYGTTGNGTSGTADATPIAIVGLTFKSLVSLSNAVCGLTFDGTAYCWGSNSSGQVGIGSTVTPQTTPQPVTGGLSFKKLYAGGAHICGVTTTDAIYCWGHNSSGQVGTGDVVSPQTSPVPATALGGLNFSKLSLGQYHSCGIDTSNNTYCWGLNTSGELGLGNTVSPQTSPQLVTGGHSFSDIYGGYYYSCGTATSGETYCWGRNDLAQLAIGNTVSPQTTPTLVISSDTSAFAVKKIVPAPGDQYAIALAETTGGCTLPNSATKVPSSWFDIFYQSATPTGACVPEWRTCTSGVLSGSYTQTTCTPGCDARTETWNGVATGCTAALPALAGGGSAVITDAIGSPTGTATANCSVTGVLTLSGTTCNP